MKKRMLLLFIPILFAVCFFCGCRPEYNITINIEGLEKGERVFVLVDPADGDDIAEITDEDIKGSGVYRADKDGFVLAEQIPSVMSASFNGYEEDKDEYVKVSFASKDERTEFCEK